MTKGEQITLLDIAFNAILGFFKYILGHASGSLALKADAYHSFVDILIPLLIFIGLKVTERKTKIFPFGLYKVENLLSLIIGVVMLFAGIEIIKEAAFSSSIIQGDKVIFTSAVIVVLAVFTYLWASYKIRIGREILSPSITSDGHHSRIESFTLLLISLGLLGKNLPYLPIDKCLAVIISLAIFRISLTIIWDAIKVLLDGSVDKETQNTIKAVLLAHPLVESVSELLIRRSGKYLFVEAVISLNCNNLDLVTEIKHELQDNINNAIANIERIIIDYIKSANNVYAIMADNIEGDISRNLARAPFVFFVKEGAENNMEIVSNPVTQLEKQKGITLINFLKDKGAGTVITRGDIKNKGILTLLQNANIQHIAVNFQNISDFTNRNDRRIITIDSPFTENLNVH